MKGKEESKDSIENGQVRIFYKPSSILGGNVGHIALQTNKHDVSLYPEIPREHFNARAYFSSWPARFKEVNREKLEKEGYKVINLYGFDTEKMNNFVDELKKVEKNLSWAIWGKRMSSGGGILQFNCASMVFYLLKIGGLNTILENYKAMEKAASFFDNNKTLSSWVTYANNDPNFKARIRDKDPSLIKLIASLNVMQSIAGIRANLIDYNYNFHLLDCNLLMSPEKAFKLAQLVEEKQAEKKSELGQEKKTSDEHSSSSSSIANNQSSMWESTSTAVGIVAVAAAAVILGSSFSK